jgi:hypothetical protein
MTGEMIERVAKLLCEIRTDHSEQAFGWDALSDSGKQLYRFDAARVIGAMREPAEAMIIAGVHHDNMGDMAGRWKAMIDAALSDRD